MKKVIFRLISLVLTITLVVTINSVTFAELVALEQMYLSKISDEVWETEPDENGNRLIYISRNRINDYDIETEFFNTYGFSVQDYEDEETYYSKIVPRITKSYYENIMEQPQSSKETAATDANKLEVSEEELIKAELNKDYNNFIKNKRSIISKKYDQYNNGFISRNSIDSKLIKYKGMYTGAIIMLASEQQIKDLAKDVEVNEITIWKNEVQKCHMSNIHKQVYTDDWLGTKGVLYNDRNGYNGSGINVGIIEAEGGRFDPNSPHLKT